jgi:hypothetical protein
MQRLSPILLVGVIVMYEYRIASITTCTIMLRATTTTSSTTPITASNTTTATTTPPANATTTTTETTTTTTTMETIATTATTETISSTIEVATTIDDSLNVETASDRIQVEDSNKTTPMLSAPLIITPEEDTMQTKVLQVMDTGIYRSHSALPYLGPDTWYEIVDNNHSFYLRSFDFPWDDQDNATPIIEWLQSKPRPVTIVVNNQIDRPWPLKRENNTSYETLLLEPNLYRLYNLNPDERDTLIVSIDENKYDWGSFNIGILYFVASRVLYIRFFLA